MPLPSDVTAALAVVAGYIKDDENKAREVALAIRREDELQLKPVGAYIYNAGASSKKGESTKTVKDLEATVAELTEAKEELEQQIEAAKSKPNEQQAEWDRQKKKLEDAKAKIETDLKAEREGRQTDRVTAAAGKPLLHLTGRIEPEWLSKVVAADIKARVKPGEQGVQFVDAAGEPIDGDEEAAAKVLAEEMYGAVPDRYRLREMVPGGGVSGGGSNNQVTADQLAEQKARSGKYLI